MCKPKAKDSTLEPVHSSQDLTFIQTHDLLVELAKRHDAMVFLGMKFTSIEGGYDIKRLHTGHRYVCLGMMANMESLINKIENDNLKYKSQEN